MTRNEGVIKYRLTRVGEWATPGMIHDLAATINYLEVGRWMRADGYGSIAPSQTAGQLFEIVAPR